MLNFERIKFNSSQKVKVLDGNKIVLIINIEYYDKSNIQCINNLKILNISNELLPVHYKLELKKHNYLKKLITFSSPKIIDKNIKIHEVTLLINNVTKEVLYTFDKVYKKEFKY